MLSYAKRQLAFSKMKTEKTSQALGACEVFIVLQVAG